MIDFSTYGPLIAPEDERIADLGTETDLVAVCAAIRNWCGWHVAPAKVETLTLDQLGQRVLTLPSLHVTAVSSVTDADDNPITGFDWRGIGQLWRAEGWPWGYRAVKVTVTHGFTTAPPEIVAVAAHMLRERADEIATGGPPLKTAQLDGAMLAYDTAKVSGLLRSMDDYAYAIGRYRL